MIGSKKYKIGMYGGKFCPMHLGHRYVLTRAMTDCEQLHVFMFYDTPDEIRSSIRWFTDPRFRVSQIARNIRDISYTIGDCECSIHTINSKKYTMNGVEDWYAEAERIKEEVGRIDAVYSSEPSYDAFFKQAYPKAEHIVVDAERTEYPIHSADLRVMDDTDTELYGWLA